MLKMLLDPMGGIVMTNDGNCILREVDVSHPAAKSMIELSRAQEEEVGDGTTSVIILSKFSMLFAICNVNNCFQVEKSYLWPSPLSTEISTLPLLLMDTLRPFPRLLKCSKLLVGKLTSTIALS